MLAPSILNKVNLTTVCVLRPPQRHVCVSKVITRMKTFSRKFIFNQSMSENTETSFYYRNFISLLSLRKSFSLECSFIFFSLPQLLCPFGPCRNLSYKVTPWVRSQFFLASEILNFARMFLLGFLHQTFLSPAGSWEWNLNYVASHRQDVVIRSIWPCDLSLGRRSAS